MTLLGEIVRKSLVKRGSKLTRAYASQQKTLNKLLLKAGNTAFGKQYKFSEILFSDNVVEEFQKTVPFHSYKEMNEWWKRSFDGEKSVCWPGKIKYFALSSGTSEGSSKYIPVTKQTLKAITRASFRQMVNIGRCRSISNDRLARHSLMIAGSTSLNFNGKNFSGDLSGITTDNMPFWFEPFARPTNDIRKLSWNEKNYIAA